MMRFKLVILTQGFVLGSLSLGAQSFYFPPPEYSGSGAGTWGRETEATLLRHNPNTFYDRKYSELNRFGSAATMGADYGKIGTWEWAHASFDARATLFNTPINSFVGIDLRSDKVGTAHYRTATLYTAGQAIPLAPEALAGQTLPRLSSPSWEVSRYFYAYHLPVLIKARPKATISFSPGLYFSDETTGFAYLRGPIEVDATVYHYASTRGFDGVTEAIWTNMALLNHARYYFTLSTGRNLYDSASYYRNNFASAFFGPLWLRMDADRSGFGWKSLINWGDPLPAETVYVIRS
jgi:hypothetical protein